MLNLFKKYRQTVNQC